MKKLLVLLFLFLWAVPAYSEEPGTSAVDYGTMFTCQDGILGIIAMSPTWTPDGKKIAYIDGDFIYMVPAEGGTPEKIYTSAFLYNFEGKNYSLSRFIHSLAGFSDTGGKLYFNMFELEPSSIAVQVNGLGDLSANASEQTPCVECLDVKTGKITTMFRNAYAKTVSPSGRYLLYVQNVENNWRVKDLYGSADWQVAPVTAGSVLFTQDEKHVLYLTKTNELNMVSIENGEQTLIYTPSGNDYRLMDCSPDGKWAICLELGSLYDFSYEHVFYDEAAQVKIVSHRSGTSHRESISAINLFTGEKVEILPETEGVIFEQLEFSPDGKSICYNLDDRKDFSRRNHSFILFAKDISLPSSSDLQLSVADATPKGIALTGNYPNPFNPSTHIAFTIPAPGTVQLSVYDVTGRKVRDLVSSTLTAGAHEMVWDGRDASGVAVSSGTYIARLKMGNLTASHRMTLMK